MTAPEITPTDALALVLDEYKHADAIGRVLIIAQHGHMFVDALTAQAAEVARLTRERDEASNLRDMAVKNANERDMKWMSGIVGYCGTDIDFTPIGNPPSIKPRPPTLGQFIANLRDERDAVVKEQDRLRSECISLRYYSRELIGHMEECGTMGRPAVELALHRLTTPRACDDPTPALIAQLAAAVKERDDILTEVGEFKAAAYRLKVERDAATAELAKVTKERDDARDNWGTNEDQWRETCAGLRSQLSATTAELGRAREARISQFLCRATGFKMHFNAAGNCVSFQNYAKELEGRWVALVPAEDNCHMQLAPPRAERGGWIACGERMPDVGQRVIGWFPKYSNVAATHFRPLVRSWALTGGDYEWEECTHWQPLPEPPTSAAKET